jgi:drug/metabolite transporter (DMT)-like permease
MPEPGKGYWFPAKRYGWGWGPPTRWQGWGVLGAYALLLALAAFTYLPSDDVGAFLACAIVLTIALMALCWLKGERPRWRWGDREP